MVQDIFKECTLYLAIGVEGAASFVIGLAAFQAVIRALSTFLGRSSGRGGEVRDDIRFDLGRWLALGLEFELAADILRTAVAPTWNEIGQLAAIAVLGIAMLVITFTVVLAVNRIPMFGANSR